jgi:ribosomal protein S14
MPDLSWSDRQDLESQLRFKLGIEMPVLAEVLRPYLRLDEGDCPVTVRDERAESVRKLNYPPTNRDPGEKWYRCPDCGHQRRRLRHSRLSMFCWHNGCDGRAMEPVS